MKRRAARASGVIGLLVCCAVFGQRRDQRKDTNEDTNTRAVQGIVRDSSGHPVAKAVVQLEDTKSLQIRSFITESDGSYHFAGLSTNVEYTLKASYDGASARKKNLGVFNTRKVATIDFKLKK